MNSSPIFFCHYGISNYLEYTLYAAKLTNPQKKIYLLGDISNLKIARKVGIVHIDYKQFDFTKSIIEFNNNFKFIAGSKHGRYDWTKFVFLRWFYINEFIHQNHIDSFWHFDSDNFILTDLSEKENIFKQYDNTEQCGGICLNGFISSKRITHLYTKHIIDLFLNEDYLNIQRDKCQVHDNFAFTEMAAYNDFKKVYKINSIRLNNVECGDTFDDCLACSDGMIQTNETYNDYNIKEIYLNRSNEIFFKMISSNKFIRVNSINLSWLPFSIVIRIFYLILRQRVGIFKYFNFVKKSTFSKVNFLHYSIPDKIFNKLVFLYIKVKY